MGKGGACRCKEERREQWKWALLLWKCASNKFHPFLLRPMRYKSCGCHLGSQFPHAFTVHRFQSQISSSTVPVCMCQGNFRANPGWNFLLSSWDALPFISDAQMLPLQKKVVKANKTNNGEIRWGRGHEPWRCNSPSLPRKKWNLDFTSFRLWREKGNKVARPFLQV